jgi:hypothetical protein
MQRRRISHSPLLDPTVCAVILMAPFSQELLSLSPSLPAWHHEHSLLIAKAAGVVGVPIFTLSWRGEGEALPSAGEPYRTPQHQFLLEDYQCPWFNPSFVEALAREDVSRLIVAGFWLEHEVLGTALHALAACYDVAILVDLTGPARRMRLSRPESASARPVPRRSLPPSLSVSGCWALQARWRARRLEGAVAAATTDVTLGHKPAARRPL